MNPGPAVAALTHRLADTPSDFLAEAAIGSQGQVVVAAVVADLWRDLHRSEPSSGMIHGFAPHGQEGLRNWQQLVLVACWLMRDPWFMERASLAVPMAIWMQAGLRELAEMVKAERYVHSENHREELARLCLKALELVPAGENQAQAQDRLETVSTLERRRVTMEANRIREQARQRREALTKQQEEKARIAREELEKRAAESGAAKVSRD